MIKETTSPKSTVEDPFVLQYALEGKPWAINQTLFYLGSANPLLCRRMKKAIYAFRDPLLWTYLLNYLALRRWDSRHDYQYFYQGGVSEQIDHAIIEVFTVDEGEFGISKISLLRQAIESKDPKICQAAAFLLGLRGERRAIPTLAEIIEFGDERWQLRAVKALMVINDEACGPPLLRALACDRDRLHRDARRALQSLGEKARQVWLEALSHPDRHIRWHAARGLAEMGDGCAADVLAEGLFVEDYVVQWSTAKVLSELGNQAIPGVLTALSQHTLNELARKATIQTLQENKSEKYQNTVKPLLNALLVHMGGDRVQILATDLLTNLEQPE